MSATASSEQRELSLVLKLELRLGNANTDDKLQSLLQTYLPPLLLKLASEHVNVRNKVIGVCQYVLRRLKSSPKISLPLPALLKQFREFDNAFVKQFDLLFFQHGLEQISTQDGVAILPEILKASIPEGSFLSKSSEGKTWSVTFHFLLRLLRSWKLPDRLTKEGMALKDQLQLSDLETNILAYWLMRFLLYDGRATSRLGTATLPSSIPLGIDMSNTLLQAEDEFMSPFDAQQPRAADLQTVKANVAKFLFTSVFSDSQRFIPAVILTSDPSSLEYFRIGDTMFKQCDFSFESPEVVDKLLSLSRGKKTRIQIRVLNLLSRSKEAAQRTSALSEMISGQLAYTAEGLEASRLRTSLFSFIEWTIRMCEANKISQIAPTILTAMRDFIESQGWPSPQYALGKDTTLSLAQLDMRKQAYSCIGSLAAKSQSRADMMLVNFLFTSLRCDSSHPEVHEAVNEALGRVINNLNFFEESGVAEESGVVNASAFRSLKGLLLLNMVARIGQEGTGDGYVAAYSTRYAAIKCANRCLPFHDADARFIDLLGMVSLGKGEPKDVPEVAEEGARGLDLYLHRSAQVFNTQASTGNSIELPDFDQLVALIYRNQDEQSFDTETFSELKSGPGVSFCRNMLILNALKSISKMPDIDQEWRRHLDGLIANDESTREAMREFLLGVGSESLISLITYSLIGLSRGLEESGAVALELCALAPNKVLEKLCTPEIIALCQQGFGSSSLKVQQCSARCYGILASLKQTADEEDLRVILRPFEEWESLVGQHLIDLRGHVLSIAFRLSRQCLRKQVYTHAKLVREFVDQIRTIMQGTRDQTLKEACHIAISQSCLCLPYDFELELQPDQLLDSLMGDAKNAREAAVTAIGRLTRFESKTKEDFVETALENLYSLHEIRKPELQFAVGEALAVASTGWHSTSTITEFDVDGEKPSQPVDDGMLANILSKTIENCKATKPSLRKAAAIWLLCLIQYCGKETPVALRLRDCQAAFGRLLTDRDEVVQETGSRGLGLVYEMGNDAVRHDLIRDLVQSFTGNSAKLGGTVTEDTQLFEAGALPTEGGASVTTYKDIVSLANEVGDPSLVYRFMNLASNNAIWTSRAAFGRFGLSNILADSKYLAENKRFYPKLFRYRFDPNPNIQRSMNDIWKALVKNPNEVINQNFDAIMEDLLRSILGKEWRVREASCAAIADLVQDREVEKFEKYLGEIWKMAFKVVDDIKESVRIAALTLCRTLVGLLIRNLEVGDGLTKRASTLLEHALEFLIQQFTAGGAKEVQTYAIGSLLEIVRKCPPKALRPYSPVLLESLITSLSSLEHESINYLHLNADKYGLTADKLDSMRVSGVNASPVTECIERCLESLDSMESPEAIKEAMRRLEVAFKESIGLPSRVGLSRVMVTLVVRHNLMFRPYVDRFVQLNRKSVVDRNTTISISFATSLAYLMRLASDKQVRETAKFAQNLYFDSEQTSNRALAGEIIQAFAKVSNDVFMRFATSFLPFAFIGRSDTDAEVRERFEITWKDNVGGSRSVSLYSKEIIDMVQANIESARWAIKHTCSLAVADLIESTDPSEQYSQAQADLIWPVLEEALSGKAWEGKEKVVAAYPRYVKKATCSWNDEDQSRQISLIALREAKRTNIAYRPHAITALGEFAIVRNDLDLSADMVPYLRNVVDEVMAADLDRMEIDAGKGADREADKASFEKTLVACVHCMFRVLSPAATQDALDHATWIVERTRNAADKSVRLSVLEGAKSLVERLSGIIDGARRNKMEEEDREKRRRGEKAVEVFTCAVVLALVDDNGPISYEYESENLRHARVSLALAAVNGRVARALPRGKLERVFRLWLEKERSRPVRDEIQALLLANETRPDS